MKKLKSNIGWLIEKSNYSRLDIMQIFSKSRNTVSNWCTGKSYPSAPEMYYLAELLECEVGDLYKVIEE
jgi:transcriptional regulator with XRE-family HTH domain